MHNEPEGRFRDLDPRASSAPSKERPLFIVTLRPELGVNGIRALRAFLKTSLRRFGLRCITISQHPPSA